eukprot:15408169-Alexandrium_andersonii.AAC.1
MGAEGKAGERGQTRAGAKGRWRWQEEQSVMRQKPEQLHTHHGGTVRFNDHPPLGDPQPAVQRPERHGVRKHRGMPPKDRVSVGEIIR